MTVNPVATYGVYLAVNLPICLLAVRITRWPLPTAIAGSVLAMAVAVWLQGVLPFHFWAHANDLIVKPLLRDVVIHDPMTAIPSLLFHLVIPVGIVCWIARRLGWAEL